MRHGVLSLSLGLALGAVACSDAVTSRIAAPSDVSASKNPYTGPGGGRDKVTICHAAGRAGTTHYVEITVGAPAQYGHIDEHGTPQAGHEEDYYTTPGSGCSQGGTVAKKLVDVMTVDAAGNMITDPVWLATGNVVIPAGQTRWLDYEISYSIPGSGGTITENEANVCNTMGAAEVNHPGSGQITCSFNWGMASQLATVVSGVGSWGVSGTGTLVIPIDVSGGGVFCGKRTLTNTAVFKLSNGSTLNATASTLITFLGVGGRQCP